MQNCVEKGWVSVILNLLKFNKLNKKLTLESDNSDDEVMSINSDEPLKKSKKNVPTPRRTRAMRTEGKQSMFNSN